LGQADAEGLYPADKGELRRESVFFFLVKIKSEKKEQDTNHLIGGPVPEPAEGPHMLKIGGGDDLFALVADDFFHFAFDEGGELGIADIHVQFHAGVGADPVDIIGSVCHPYSIIGGHFTM